MVELAPLLRQTGKLSSHIEPIILSSFIQKISNRSPFSYKVFLDINRRQTIRPYRRYWDLRRKLDTSEFCLIQDDVNRMSLPMQLMLQPQISPLHQEVQNFTTSFSQVKRLTFAESEKYLVLILDNSFSKRMRNSKNHICVFFLFVVNQGRL